jgi:outer membrane lipoprotein-sorting protein
MRRLSLITAVFICLSAPYAQAVQKHVAAKKQTVVSTSFADIARVENYLSGITSITADFNQADARGGVAGGKFYLQRPGKMRWEYAPPTPILIVCDGTVLTYYDSELKQVSYVGIDDTLAAFLTRPVIKLNSAGTKLTNFTSANRMIRATVIQATKPDEGSLTLEFSDAPLQLRALVIADATGNRTSIQLQNMKYGEKLPSSLFKFIDPRERRSTRR